MNAILQKNFDNTNKIIIDWFSFTTSIISVQDVIKLLGMEDCPFTKTGGFYGFLYRLSFGNISIHYGGVLHENLVMLEMSGQGCRTFESLSSHGDFNILFEFCISNPVDCKVTRLDVAFDDFSGYLNIDDIVSDTYKRNFVSKFRFPPEVHSSVYDDYIAYTVTHGKRNGDIFIRIYDKAAERHKKDEIKHWVRCELQLRSPNWNKKINKPYEFLRLMISENKMIDTLFFSFLNKYLRYIKPSSTDSNKSRFDIAEHWFDFYNYINTIEVSLYKSPGMDYNSEKLRQTYGERFAGGIYTYLYIFGVERLIEDVQKAKSKLNPRYELLLAEYDDFLNSSLDELYAELHADDDAELACNKNKVGWVDYA